MSIGIDVYEGNGPIDWTKVIAAGVEFVGIRACEGTRKDARFASYRAALDAMHVPTFAWLFLRFEPTGPSPEDQGKCLIDVIEENGGENEYDLTPAIDLEFPAGQRPDEITAGEALEWFLRCYTTVKAGLGGADPGVYTSQEIWNDRDGMNQLSCGAELIGAWSWMKYWPYAQGDVAIYDPATVNALAPPPVASPFAGNWQMHQYMGDAVHFPGIPTEIDMNRMRVVKEGDHGGTVQWIQRKLKITDDGWFGPVTTSAVKSFQAARSLVVDGLVGVATTSCLSRVV